jgi:RNA polymerase sigma-70 factor (ECF subfamily)
MRGSDGVDLAERPGPAVAPLERLAAAEQESRLLAAIEALPARQREMVHLKFARGLKYREIAEVTGTTVGNVGSVLHTALNRLRALLDGAPEEARSES